MKKHSKLMALFLTVALLAVAFTVVVSAMATPDEIVDEPASPPVQEEAPAPEAETEADEEAVPGGIVTDDDIEITATAHAYKEEKLLCVTAANKSSETAYSIDLTVSYLDANGVVIGTETQSFDQLDAEFSWNFIFRPGYDFADYRIETAKTVFEGECWKTCITDVHVINEGYLQVKFYNNRDKETFASNFKMVIFDENGEVFDVHHKSAWVLGECNSYRTNGVSNEDCPYVGCTDEHPIDHDEYEACGIGRLNAFVTHEVNLPETHPDYEYWMQFADLPGNIFGDD